MKTRKEYEERLADRKDGRAEYEKRLLYKTVDSALSDLTEITDRISKSAPSYFEEYNARYKDGNSAYRTKEDATEWYKRAESQEKLFSTDYDSAMRILDRYKPILDAESVDKLTKYLDENASNMSEIAKSAKTDSDFWGSFADENEYGRWLSKNQKYIDAMKNKDWSEQSKPKDYNQSTDPRDYQQYYDTMVGGNPSQALNAVKPLVSDPLGLFLGADNTQRQGGATRHGGDSFSYDEYAKTMYQGIDRHWDQINDTETAYYYYLYNTEGQDAALSYLNSMTNTFGERFQGEIRNNVDEAGWLGKVFLNALSIPATVIGGVPALASDAINTMLGRDIEPYDGAHSLLNFANAVRASTATQIDERTGNASLPFIGTTFGDVYQSLMSGADSVVGSKFFGKAYTVAMGMNSASNEARRLYEQGADKSQIVLGGFLSGLAEVVFESFSLDHFLKGNPVSVIDSVAFGLKQAGVEASEELFTEIANILTNALVMQDKSDLQQIISKYEKNGKTAAEAIAEELVPQALNAALGGFISGGAMSLLGGTSKIATNEIVGKEISNAGNRGAMIDYAMKKFDPKSAEYKAAAKAKARTESANAGKAKGIIRSVANKFSEFDTNVSLGAIQTEMARSAGQRYAEASDITQKQVRSLLAKEGVTKDTTDLAYAITKSLKGETLDKAEKKALTNSEAGMKVLRDIRADTAEKKLDSRIDYAIADNFRKSSLPLSKDGKTRLSESGQEVAIKSVVDGKNGKIALRLSDGRTVSFNDISYGKKDEAVLYESLSGMNVSANTANALLQAFRTNGTLSAEQFMIAANEVLNYGKMNHNLQYAKGSFAQNLSPHLQQFVWNLGRNEAKRAVEEGWSAVRSRTGKKAQGTRGGVHFDKSLYNSATYRNDGSAKDALKQTVKFARQVASAFGIDIYLFDSTADERHAKDNGWYDATTDSIHIDINAGREKTIVYTMAHEITHFIKQWSPEKYAALADFLVEEYGKNGVPIEQLIVAQMEKDADLTRDDAFDELVADSMESMLVDSNAVEKVAELKAKDKTLFEKIKEFIGRILSKIRAIYKNLSPYSEEGKYVRQMEGEVEKIAKLFEDAAVDAVANKHLAEIMTGGVITTDFIRGEQDGFVVRDQMTEKMKGTIKSTKTERVALPKMIMPISTNGDGRLVSFLEGVSAESFEGKGKTVNGYTVAKVREFAMRANGYAEQQITNVQDFMKAMAKFMDDAEVVYRFIGLDDVRNAKLHYRYNKDGSVRSIVLSAMVKNGDYPVNFDFTSICKKRVAMSKIIDKLVARGATDNGTLDLSPSNIFAINRTLRDAGYETACLGCFVESKRYNVQAWAEKFIKEWNEAVKQINPNAKYFSFTDGKTNFDNAPLSQIVAIENAANKFLATTGKERRDKAKADYTAKSKAGEVLIETLTKTAREKIGKSESLTEAEKDYFLGTPASEFSLEDVFTLVDNEIIGGRALSSKQRIKKLVASGVQYQRLLKPSDILTANGMTQLEKLPYFYGVLYGRYGSATPKPIQGFTPYNSEIALLADSKGKKTLTEYLYSIAGVRMQSFSDFQIQNIFDYLQMVADLAARKLPAHAYTKEISFAKLLGLTGIKTNLSVMFDIDTEADNEHAGLTKMLPGVHTGEYGKIVRKDEQGAWVYNVSDYVMQRAYEQAFPTNARRFIQSIGFADAVKLEGMRGYSANCGIVGVGYSDFHILAMLDDARIRYIIPYHSSSLPTEIKIATNIWKAKDYTKLQNTMKITAISDKNGAAVDWSVKEAYKRLGDGKSVVDELNRNIRENGWEVQTKKAQSGHGSFVLYEDLAETKNPKKTAKNFLDWCAKNGSIPLFYQFASHENYYKLLYDFSVYDADGNYAPQEAVTNTYPISESEGKDASENGFSPDYFTQTIGKYMLRQNEYNRVLDSALDTITDKIVNNSLGNGSDFSRSKPKKSQKSAEDISVRNVLANALETTINASTEEGKAQIELLREYKERVKNLDELEKHLDEVKQEIRKISFQRGKRDMARLAELQADKVTTQNRISIQDKRLLEVEATKPLRNLIRIELDKAKAKYRKLIIEERARSDERRGVEYYRPRVISIVSELSDRLLHPSAKKAIPDAFGASIANFLKQIDLTTYNRNGQEYGGNANKERAAVREALANLSEQLSGNSIENEYGQLDISPEMLDWIKAIAQIFEETLKNYGEISVNKMGAEDLEMLYKFLKSLRTSVNWAGQMYCAKSSNVSDLAVGSIEHLKPLFGRKENLLLSGIDKTLRWDFAQPVTVFDRFGDSGRTLMQILAKGVKKEADNEGILTELVDSAYTREEVTKWREEILKIEIGDKEFNVPSTFVMGLYREMLDEDARRHIVEGGGIRFRDAQIGKKVTRFADTFISLEEVNAAIERLDDRQKQVADILGKFMTEKGGEWLNEISMTRFGYRAATNPHYFPIETIKKGSEYEAKQKRSNIYALLNKSFTKERHFGANNAIIVGDIFETFSNHMSEMALYNAWALPVIDLIKWFNYREAQDIAEQKSEVSIRDALRQAYGAKADEYIRKLLESINGQKSGGLSQGIAFSVMRMTNRVAVAGNVRVAIQQPFSITRALELINAKYLKPLFGKARRDAYNEMVEISSFGKWKGLGYFDVNISKPLETKVLKNQTFADRFIDKTMVAAEDGDKFTWVVLWSACKSEVMNKYKGLSDEEILERTKERFDDIVVRTQVVDSVLTKSQWMRADDFWHRSTSSFMSEPMTSYNALLRRFDALQRDLATSETRKDAIAKNAKPIAVSVAVFALTQLVNALVTAPIDACRDDDDYETFWGKLLKNFKENSFQNLLPTSMMPYVNDIIEYIRYGRTSRPDIDLYVRAVDIGKQINGILNGYSFVKLHSLVDKALSLTSVVSGLPLGNIARDAVAIWNSVVGLIGDGHLKFQTAKDSPSAGYDNLYKALNKGDESRADELLAQLQSNGVDKSRIYSGLSSLVRKDFLDGALTDEEAEKRLEGINRFLGEEKHDAYWNLQKWKFELENGTSEGYGKYDEFFKAVSDGKNLKKIIKQYTDNGADEKTLASQLTSHFKPIYREMTRAERARVKGFLLNAYDLLGYDRAKKSKEIDGWLKD